MGVVSAFVPNYYRKSLEDKKIMRIFAAVNIKKVKINN
jgi:hypothetical protein